MPVIDRGRGMRRGSATGTLVALLGLALTACADPEPNPTPAATPASSSSATAGSSSTTSDAPTPAPSTAPAPTSTAALTPDSPVTLAFGGDVHFEGRLTNLLTPDGLGALQPVLGAADVAVVNLETAITDRGVEQPHHTRDAKLRVLRQQGLSSGARLAPLGHLAPDVDRDGEAGRIPADLLAA